MYLPQLESKRHWHIQGPRTWILKGMCIYPTTREEGDPNPCQDWGTVGRVCGSRQNLASGIDDAPVLLQDSF